jgi:FHA domain
MRKKVPGVVQKYSRRRGPAFTFTPPPPQMNAPVVPHPASFSMQEQAPMQNQPAMQGQPYAPNQPPMQGPPAMQMQGQPYAPNQAPMQNQPAMQGQPYAPNQPPMPAQVPMPGQPMSGQWKGHAPATNPPSRSGQLSQPGQPPVPMTPPPASPMPMASAPTMRAGQQPPVPMTPAPMASAPTMRASQQPPVPMTPAPMASALTVRPGQPAVPTTPPPFSAGMTGQPGYQGPPSQGAAPPAARVLIEIDGNVVGSVQLNKPTMTVGRLNGSDVQVPNQRVSRLHARMLAEQGAWVIEDAESVNGIMYQDQRVKRVALKKGDRIYLAPNVVIQYETM